MSENLKDRDVLAVEAQSGPVICDTSQIIAMEIAAVKTERFRSKLQPKLEAHLTFLHDFTEKIERLHPRYVMRFCYALHEAFSLGYDARISYEDFDLEYMLSRIEFYIPLMRLTAIQAYMIVDVFHSAYALGKIFYQMDMLAGTGVIVSSEVDPYAGMNPEVSQSIASARTQVSEMFRVGM